jgi:hypothetical protein
MYPEQEAKQRTVNRLEKAQAYDGACRENAVSIMRQKVEALRKEAHDLEALAYAVEGVSGNAEAALYAILTRR